MADQPKQPGDSRQVDPAAFGLHANHPRHYQLNRFVYPVLSRRGRGLSIGINLNPDKVCNFDCIYCQVDREMDGPTGPLDPKRLGLELEAMLDLAESGRLYEQAPFSDVPVTLRRLNDIAFSGDGEPTAARSLPEVVAEVGAIKIRRKLHDVKLVLITNGSGFHRPRVRQALELLDAHGGEIWAKLDAGTAAYFREIARGNVGYRQVLDNILEAARIRPLVIQSLFMNISGVGPGHLELLAYCNRLLDILKGGGMLARVQVYTVARPAIDPRVGPLAGSDLQRIGEVVRQRVSVPVEVF